MITKNGSESPTAQELREAAKRMRESYEKLPEYNKGYLVFESARSRRGLPLLNLCGDENNGK